MVFNMNSEVGLVQDDVNVLLVDDEPGILDLAKIYLEKEEEDFVVETVLSGKEAVELLEERDYSCIVSDYQMPEMNGLELLEVVREDLEIEVPFIMFTGRGREEVAIKALNLGADRYIQKGGDPNSQYAVLAEAIKQEHKSYKTEMDLIQSEREKRLVLDTTTELISYMDTDLTIRWANRAAGESVGMEPGKLKGEKCYDVWHDREKPCDNCPVQKALETGLPHKGEVESPDGRHWLVSGTPVFDEDGEVDGVIEATLEITGLKKAVSKLERSRDEYKNLLDAMKDTVWVIDMEGNFLEVNQSAVDNLGYNEAELLEMGPEDIDRSMSSEEVERKLKRIREEGNLVFNTTHLTKDGDEVPVEVSNNLIKYEGEEAVLSVARDITTRKKSKRKLRERVKELDLLYSLSSLEDEEEEVEGFLSRSVELLPKAMQYPSKCNAKLAYRESVFKTKRYVKTNNCIKSDIVVNGDEQGFVEVCYEGQTGFLDEERRLLEELSHRVSNVIERYLSKERLARSEERYRRLFETAQDGMLILDSDSGVIKDANPYIQDLLGYRHDEMVGKRLWELGLPQDQEENKERFDKLVDEGYIRYEDLPLQTKDGEEVYVEFVSNTYLVGDERVIQCNIRDITSRKKAQGRREFLHSLLRHDLMNKIQLIKGYHELIRETELPDPAKEYFKKAGKAVNKSIDMTEKIKTLYKIDEETETKIINLNPVIKNVISELQPHAQQKNMEITFSGKADKVVAGPLIKELLKNLIENSIRHSGGTEIQIETKVTEGDCKITIEDDGRGLPTTTKKLFEKGYKDGDNAGSGLGLYYVKTITKRYNGEIMAGESDEGGAKFTIKLRTPTKQKQIH